MNQCLKKEADWGLKDVKEKFDTVIEGINMVRETLERHKEENQREHEEFKETILGVQVDVSVLNRCSNPEDRCLRD